MFVIELTVNVELNTLGDGSSCMGKGGMASLSRKTATTVSTTL